MTLPRLHWLPCLVALALAGCDPKLTGVPDDDGGPIDDPDPTVTAEARAIGNILALHAEILRAGTSVAAAFDAAAAVQTRAMLPTGCWALTEASATPAEWHLRLNGCTDSRGTAYTGGGQFEEESGVDGYGFFPWYDVDLLRAVNTEDDNYNHDVHSGSLGLAFTRASGAVTSVHVDRFLRHNVRSEIVTFTYDATFTGASNSMPEYPDASSTARVVWDSVGIIDVDFGTGAATYAMQGVLYSVALATGEVTAVDLL
jgi:hypothetical protein